MLTSIFDLFDTHSFASVWYWVMLACAWSMASWWVMGVPWDMVRGVLIGRADGVDLRLMVQVQIRRFEALRTQSPLALTICGSAVVAFILSLGFLYDIEIAQGIAFLLLPFCLAAVLSLRLARRLAPMMPDGIAVRDLALRLRRQRRIVRAVGVLCLFVTAFWGLLVLIRPYL